MIFDMAYQTKTKEYRRSRALMLSPLEIALSPISRCHRLVAYRPCYLLVCFSSTMTGRWSLANRPDSVFGSRALDGKLLLLPVFRSAGNRSACPVRSWRIRSRSRRDRWARISRPPSNRRTSSLRPIRMLIPAAVRSRALC